MIQVSIPTDLETFVEGVIRSGTYENASAVIADALRLLERRESLRREVQKGLDDLEQGRYTVYGDDDLERFLQDIRDEEARRYPEENR